MKTVAGKKLMNRLRSARKVDKYAYETILTEDADIFHISLLRPYNHRDERPPLAALPSGFVEHEVVVVIVVEKIFKHDDKADKESLGD